MFFRSRPAAPPAATHTTLPLAPDTIRPRSSSHAPPTARSKSHAHNDNINSSASSFFPSNNASAMGRTSIASNHSASPTSHGQPTPQLLHRSSTSNGPFSSFSSASSSPSLSPAASSQQQQHLLLNSSFSLSTSSSSSQLHSSGQSAPAHYSYHHFSQKMKDPLASTLVKRLKAIVTSVTSRPPPHNDQLAATSRDIHTQLHALTSQLPQHPLFARISRDELVNAQESMEKFVLSKLHTALYYPANPASPLLQRSRAFYAKCRALSWLHGRHLELPAGKQDAVVWREAGMELRRMAEYKAPKDKLVCLLNACHIIHHTLLSRTGETDGEVEVGADDIFPAFIFTLVHAHPRHFLLDLRWVSAGKYPEAMKGECEYWVTMAESAIVFIERMNEQSLRVEREGEWDTEMSKARAEREEERKRRKETALGLDRHCGGTVADVAGRGSRGKAQEEEKRVAEDEERGGRERSDSDRDSDNGASASTARLSTASHSSLGGDDSAGGQRLTLNTDDELNSSTASSTSSSSHFSNTIYTPPNHSPNSSPLAFTTPLPSPLLIPSSTPLGSASMSLLCHGDGSDSGTDVLSPSSSSAECGGGVDVGGLSLTYVRAEACELGATDVVRLLMEYKEMAAIIRKWSKTQSYSH